MVRDHRIQTEKFVAGSLVGANFDVYTDPIRTINGILIGVRVNENNFAATGSLILAESGNNATVLWQMSSGTATGQPAASGTYYPVAIARDTNNNQISGTAFGLSTSEIPLFGNYRLTGSGLGASKSGLGIELIYKMG